MKLEDLTKEGLSEDLAKKVLALHKQSIDGNYVPKETFNAERDKVKTANDTIAQRDQQITELGKFKGDAEALQKKVNDLTAENTKNKEEYEAKLKDLDEVTAIRAAISDKVYSFDDILPKLDRSKLTFKDGKVEAGLTEQLEAIQKASPHYFKADAGSGKGLPGGWDIFGRSPGEGDPRDAKNEAIEFGKNLAKAQIQGIDSTNKAADIYFK